MSDDNVIEFKSKILIPEVEQLCCPECGESHFRLFTNGDVQCLECEFILEDYVLVET